VSVAELLKDLNINFLRAGCFKPRTSPYSFPGMEHEGLRMLAEIKNIYDLNIVTEVKDATQVEAVAEVADVIQIGAKAMWDYGIYKKLSSLKNAVLVKRSFAATTQESCQMVEYLFNSEKYNVMVCERGIRTFEPNTRFTLDLCGAAWIKKNTNIPLVLDPSHAMGYSYGVPELTLACTVTKPAALLVEVHPDPKNAKSDSAQQLNFDEFRKLHADVKKVASAVGCKIV
jgi:3-deoxy-7-phosphoheptulonate synthase